MRSKRKSERASRMMVSGSRLKARKVFSRRACWRGGLDLLNEARKVLKADLGLGIARILRPRDTGGHHQEGNEDFHGEKSGAEAVTGARITTRRPKACRRRWGRKGRICGRDERRECGGAYGYVSITPVTRDEAGSAGELAEGDWWGNVEWHCHSRLMPIFSCEQQDM